MKKINLSLNYVKVSVNVKVGFSTNPALRE